MLVPIVGILSCRRSAPINQVPINLGIGSNSFTSNTIYPVPINLGIGSNSFTSNTIYPVPINLSF